MTAVESWTAKNRTSASSRQLRARGIPPAPMGSFQTTKRDNPRLELRSPGSNSPLSRARFAPTAKRDAYSVAVHPRSNHRVNQLWQGFGESSGLARGQLQP